MAYIGKLLVNDLKNILRDKFYVYAFVAYPIVFVVMTRFVIPWISENVYYLEPFYPMLFMMMAIMIPMVFGFITAFLIMDERDENLLTVLRVMPISRSAYLIYRMLLMTLFSFIYVAMFPALTGLVEVPFLLYLPVAVLFAVFTPVIALIINVLASNKVQGFAVMKTLGGAFLLPLFALFIAENWKYVFGLIPNFWTFMALDKVLTIGTHDYIHLGVGFAVHLALLSVLFHKFNKKF